MSMLAGVVILGIIVGLIYSLIALGFVLIYKSSHVFNLAQGEFLLFGACIGWVFATSLGLNIWIVVLLTVISCALLGLVVERIILHPLIGQPLIAIIMLTIALSMFLKGILIGIWWAPPYAYPRISFLELKLPSELGGSLISSQFLLASLISIGLIILFLLFFNYTKLGLGMRAVAEDHQVAQSLGVNVRSIFSLTWVISSIVGGIGGVLLGQLLTVSPELATLGLIVFPVALLGGMDSIHGCIVGGIIIGVAENLSAVYLDRFLPHSGGLRMIIPYLIMLFILIIKPYGIFGLKKIERI